jgi:hypothetical protein
MIDTRSYMERSSLCVLFCTDCAIIVRPVAGIGEVRHV